jgi:hypothetical protein
VREELDGLILLSDEAVQVLESQVARELPASTASAAPASAAPASAVPGEPQPERLPLADPSSPPSGTARPHPREDA